MVKQTPGNIVRESARQVWEGILDVIYPPVCLVCRGESADTFCAACVREILPLHPPFCDRCGEPIVAAQIVCPRCAEGPEPAFAWGQALGQYSGTLRTAIHRLKYDGKTALAKPLGRLLAQSLDTPSPLLPADGSDFDVVVPVPLHPARYRERGFNQAELIARAVVEQRGWHLDSKTLVRARRTTSQTKLSASARRDNVAGAFRVRAPLALDGKSVLLIDDVLTTGATIEECSRILRNAGARRVAVLALARRVD